MKVKVRRFSGSRLRKKMRRWPEQTREGVRLTMGQIGQQLASQLEAQAPKDEGHLSAAARYKVSRDGLGVSVGYSNTKDGFRREWKKGGFVALFAEFGTRHHAAKPFIRPIWRANIQNALTRINSAVVEAFKNKRD